MNKISINILEHGQKIYSELPLYRATEGAAGYDLRAAISENIELKPFERQLIPTGFAMALPEKLEAQIRPRSGLAYKNGLTVINSPGTIDWDYRGEIFVPLINLSSETQIIEPKMRIAQMVFHKVELPEFEIIELDKTMRQDQGFGSTGI